MKQLLLASLLAALTGQQAAAQAKPTDLRATEQSILQEGLALYESERASWVATDVLLAGKPDMTGIVGYVSYADGDSLRSVFLHQAADNAPITARYAYSFPRAEVTPVTCRPRPARPLSAREERLLELRLLVMQELETNKVSGQPYGFPENTRPNIVVLDQGPAPRAYILTGSQEEGVMPIGNDFLLRFSPAGKLTRVERLHNSFLPMHMPEGTTIEAGVHSHLPTHPFITATDICSVLLHQEAFPAPQHIVMGREHVSIFDAPKRQLTILNKKVFEKTRRNR